MIGAFRPKVALDSLCRVAMVSLTLKTAPPDAPSRRGKSDDQLSHPIPSSSSLTH
jgi:hypothetical protein